MARHNGLTLIETLVALGLGALILLGLSTLFAASKKTYQVNEAVARIQEDGRHAIAILESHLALAGRRPLYPDGDPGSAPTFTGTGTRPDPINPADSDANSIRINIFRFDEIGALGVGLCDGATHTGAYQDSFHFYIRDETLYCDSETGAAAKLIPGVTEMRIAYGEDTDADGYPNRWISPYTAADQVVAVRVRVRLRNTEQSADLIGARDFQTTVRFRDCHGC